MRLSITTAACLLLATFWVVPAAPLHADPAEFSPISAEMQVIGGKAFAAGMPVILHYKISSHTTDAANVCTGREGIDSEGARTGTQWLDWMLATSTEAKILPHTFASNSGGLFTESVFPSLDSPAKGDYVVSQYFDITQPGNYTLHITVRLPYRLGKDAEGGWGAGLADTLGTVYTQDFTFPLTITPADDTQLQVAAENYRKAIAQEKDVPHRRVLSDALFSMPEKQAAGSWAALAANPNTSQLAIDRLSRKPSMRTAGILASIAWSKIKIGTGTRVASRRALDALYGSAKPNMKQQIRTLYAQNEEAPPTVTYSIQDDN